LKLSRPSGAAPLLLFFVLGAASAPCRADQPTRALLLLPSCPLDGISEPELRSALALELQDDGLTLAQPGDGFGRSDVLLEVDSPCQPHAELSLRVLFQDRERARTLSLDDLPPGTRSRLLALSLAELVDRLEPAPPATEPSLAASPPEDAPSAPVAPAPEASRPKPEPRPEPRTEKPAAPQPEPVASPSASPPVDTAQPRTASDARTALELAPELRWFSSGDALFGGRIGLDAPRLVAGAGVVLGSAGAEIGDAETFLLQGFLGYRLIRSELADRFSAGFGPRVGVGWVEVTGLPLDGEVNGASAGAPYFDVAAFGDVRYVVSPYFRVSLGVEGGVCRGLTALADGEAIASYDGVFIAGFIGFMLSR
jgi:hypothetical protein